MKTTLFIGLGLVLLLVVAGCSRKAVPSTTTEVKDSTTTKEVVRYVNVEVPGKTVTVKEYIKCDSVTNKPKAQNFEAREGNSFVDVSIKDDGSVVATGGCDSLKAVIEAKDKIIEHSRSQVVTRTIYDHSPYWFDIAARWIAGVTILSVTGLALYKFNKIRPI